MQSLTDFIREFLDYYFTQVHTSFPGVIVEYDADKRRATVQPSLKRRTGNKEYIAFPLLIDVPVQFPGTKKYTIHFPLEKNDEVAVFFSERALEAWKDAGQDGIEDPDPRRFDLCDAYCVPGLQPREFIDAAAEGLDKGLSIIHKTAWDGDLIDSVLIDDDKIEVIRKQDKKDNYAFVVDKDHMETVFKKNDTLIARMTTDEGRVEVLYKEKSDILMRDDYLKIRTLISSLELNGGKVLQTSNDADIKSVAPIGLNDGLYITGLGPYLTAETTAVTALQSAAAAAAAQLAMLDAQSGAVGTITGLGTAINAFCAAMMTADSTAHTAIAKAVK